MALLNSIEPLKPLIPKPNDKYFMSMLTHVPEKVAKEHTIFAIVVDNANKIVKNVFRVAFSLFSGDSSQYLLINDITKEINSSTYFKFAKLKNGERLTIDQWGFEKDDIGLHIVTDNVIRDTIYFATSFYDVSIVREGLKKKHAKSTVTAETVYV